MNGEDLVLNLFCFWAQAQHNLDAQEGLIAFHSVSDDNSDELQIRTTCKKIRRDWSPVMFFLCLSQYRVGVNKSASKYKNEIMYWLLREKE